MERKLKTQSQIVSHKIITSQRWIISTTTATSGAVTFTPTTDSILQIPTGSAAFQISIASPATGDYGIGSVFMIDNTANSQPITVLPGAGHTLTVRGVSVPSLSIPANSTAQFVWTSANNFRLLFIAASP